MVTCSPSNRNVTSPPGSGDPTTSGIHQPASPSSVVSASYTASAGAGATAVVEKPSSALPSSRVFIAAGTRGQPPLIISTTVLPGSKPSCTTVSLTSGPSGSSSNVTRDRGSVA